MLRQPGRWLLWGSASLGGGVLTLVVAVLILVVVVGQVASGPVTASPTTTSTSSQGGGGLQSQHAWTGKRNQAVVLEALRLAAALFPGPPNGYTTWYYAERIPDAVAYWQETCTGGCAPNWAEGNLQCTMLVTASYGLVGQALPFAGDAATFVSWHPYRDLPGWQEVAPTASPWPGDIIVWDSGDAFGGAGHVAIVVDVGLPTRTQPGYVQFAQSNGASALAQSPLRLSADGHLFAQAWPGYTVLGYIRHIAAIA
jgi:hypothetical protein